MKKERGEEFTFTQGLFSYANRHIELISFEGIEEWNKQNHECAMQKISWDNLAVRKLR